MLYIRSLKESIDLTIQYEMLFFVFDIFDILYWSSQKKEKKTLTLHVKFNPTVPIQNFLNCRSVYNIRNYRLKK